MALVLLLPGVGLFGEFNAGLPGAWVSCWKQIESESKHNAKKRSDHDGTSFNRTKTSREDVVGLDRTVVGDEIEDFVENDSNVDSHNFRNFEYRQRLCLSGISTRNPRTIVIEA